MKILFGEKYYGKDTSEVPSSFLIWIIEEYVNAEWLLITACKEELSARLKLDWGPKSDHTLDLETALKVSAKQVSELLKEKEFLLDVIGMSTLCRGNPYIIEQYMNSPGYLKTIMQLIKDANEKLK